MQTDTTRENPQGSVPQAADSNMDLSATAPRPTARDQA